MSDDASALRVCASVEVFMPDTPVPVKGEGMQTFREIVTAFVALAILALSLWMLVCTYMTAQTVFDSTNPDKARHDDEIKAKTEAYGRQKDLLLYALALLGTVTGYYLGRVPAEQRAQQAQHAADTAQTHLSEANTKVIQASGEAVQATKEAASAKRDSDAAKSTLTSIRAKLEPVDSGRAKTLSAISQLSPEQKVIADVHQDIEDFLKRG